MGAGLSNLPPAFRPAWNSTEFCVACNRKFAPFRTYNTNVRLFACAFLFFAALFAQDPAKISVSTELVEVDVVVTSGGKPVTNLTSGDFTILDRGKPQKIAAFTVKNADAGNPQPVIPDPPGTVSNRPGGSGATLILFDMLNTAEVEPGDRVAAPQSFVRDQLLEYVHSLKPDNHESFAFLSLYKDLKVIRDFTADTTRIVAAAGSLIPQHSFDQAAQGEGDLILTDSPAKQHDQISRDMFKNAVREMQDNARVNRAFLTIAALRNIAYRLQAMPGRKKLIWISSGFPVTRIDQRTRNGMKLIETQDFGDAIEKTIRELNDANIAVYPIDPRDPYNTGLGGEGVDSMNLLARGTGGKAFYALTDLAGAIRQSVDDTRVTYTLSFYPEGLHADSAFHPIRVAVTGSGLDVRARKGYFAPDARPMSAKQMNAVLKDVVASPINSAGLSLKARATAPKPGVFDIDVTVDPHELHLERVNDTWVAQLELIVFAPRGQMPNAREDPIKLTLTDTRLHEVLTEGRFTLHGTVHLNAPPPADLRVALQDRVTGLAGSVTLHVTAS